jgi:indole-3-glycerol phosphate synthase
MLDKIVAATERRLPGIIARQAEFRSATTAADRSLAAALSAPGVSVIAEVKRRSPSRGMLNADLDPARQALLYEQGGASAISVLTEQDYFDGSPADLQDVRGAVGLPALRKDFIIHPAQVWESAAMGADAILLIVAILDDTTLAGLLTEASEARLPALVEVHSAIEAERALSAGAPIIGVNSRDLRTFEVDLATAEALAPLIGDQAIRVAESGIHTPGDVARMATAGFDAVLVGESLVRSDDPAELLSRFVAAGI